MIKFLIKKFVPDSENVSDKVVRERYGILSGVLGVCCNIFLFALKLTIGLLMNSIAIISDAVNNLSDTASSVVTIVSSKISNKQPDREHPYGHGRVEYIASMLVAFIIILVGFELLKSSVDKILHPEVLQFSVGLIIILAVSILVKVWMYSYNKFIGKQIKSTVMETTAVDSLNDCIATTAVILSVILGRFIAFPVDGIMGVLVSGLIIWSGINVAKEIMGRLIGEPPSEELVKSITNFVIEADGIIGVHDFMAHDYGPGATIASLHAEVPDDVNIVKIHETIDEVEKEVFEKFGVLLVIHMDPISLNCEKTNLAREMVKEVVSNINPEFSIHDFRMVDGENSVNLIFDLVVPIEMKADERKEVLKILSEKIKDKDKRYNIVVQIDNAYI